MSDTKADKSDAKTKTATCPICNGKVEVYEGDNPHKQGTGFCATEYVRPRAYAD
jgi:hypothetical protein